MASLEIYMKRTLHHLELLRTSCKWTDIVLRAESEDVDFPAHRCLLASASPYFSAMLESERFIEAGKAIVTIREVSNRAIGLLLQFIYSGTATLDVENVGEALKIANLTQVDEFLRSSEAFLIKSLDIDNIPDIWTYVIQYSLPSLKNHIIKFTGTNLLSIDRKVMLRFDGHLINSILQDAVIITTEINVVTILLQWLQFNFKCREKFAKNFLDLIFWDRIHSRDVRAMATKSIKPLRVLINEASKKPCSLIPRGMLEGTILIGGFSIDGPMNEARFLPSLSNNFRENKWMNFASMAPESRLVDFGLCALPDGGFVICGGCFLNPEMVEVRSRSAFMFDAHARRWQALKKMNKTRSGCLAIWFRNFAYVFGGDLSGGVTYERFNICNNSWEMLGELPCAPEGIAGCVIKDRIWISGGQIEKDRPSDKFVSYCPESNTWRDEEPLPVACSDHSVFYFRKRLYRVGGWTSESEDQNYTQIKQVHSFAPETGWRTEEWTVPVLNAFQQFILDGNRLLIVGGGSLKASHRFLFPAKDEKRERKVDMSYFDLETFQWQKSQQTGIQASFWDHKAIHGFLPKDLVFPSILP